MALASSRALGAPRGLGRRRRGVRSPCGLFPAQPWAGLRLWLALWASLCACAFAVQSANAGFLGDALSRIWARSSRVSKARRLAGGGGNEEKAWWDTWKPHDSLLLFMEDCSGSTYVDQMARALLTAHGVKFQDGFSERIKEVRWRTIGKLQPHKGMWNAKEAPWDRQVAPGKIIADDVNTVRETRRALRVPGAASQNQHARTRLTHGARLFAFAFVTRTARIPHTAARDVCMLATSLAPCLMRA